MEYQVQKTENPIRPFVIVNTATQEILRKEQRFETQAEAEAEIQYLKKHRQAKRLASFGGIDAKTDEQLIAEQTPAMQQYWGDKAKSAAKVADPAWLKALGEDGQATPAGD